MLKKVALDQRQISHTPHSMSAGAKKQTRLDMKKMPRRTLARGRGTCTVKHLYAQTPIDAVACVYIAVLQTLPRNFTLYIFELQ